MEYRYHSSSKRSPEKKRTYVDEVAPVCKPCQGWGLASASSTKQGLGQMGGIHIMSVSIHPTDEVCGNSAGR